MRIIAGNRRGALLTKLDAANTRPTADRVRESLFNILQGGRFANCLDNSQVIDLFAGTGALGLEALSRGASFASFVEKDATALRVIRANIAKLRFQSTSSVIAGDAISLLQWRGAPGNLIFADAPYDSGGGLQAVGRLATIGAIAKSGLIIIETGTSETLNTAYLEKHEITMLDQRRYGRALLHILKYAA
tara:strand:- start:128 stop:697 length:570 start_codon:yes stop_codon:yes gene_type:complete